MFVFPWFFQKLKNILGVPALKNSKCLLTLQVHKENDVEFAKNCDICTCEYKQSRRQEKSAYSTGKGRRSFFWKNRRA